MGGFGSGRGLIGRRTVESCLSVNIGAFAQNELTKGDAHSHGTLAWKYLITGQVSFKCQYEVNTLDPSDPNIVLIHADTDGHSPVRYVVHLTRSRPNFGGVRWWFHCPICQRRVTKLFYRSGVDRFGCRQCHDLTYRSCLESGKNDIFASLAYRAGMSRGQVIKHIRREFSR